MNPHYKSTIISLDLNGQQVTLREVELYYEDGVSIDTERESGQQFFRRKLSGKMMLLRGDFNWLDAQPIDRTFILQLDKLQGETWVTYFKSQFFKTNVEFDRDNKSATFQVDIIDQYTDILKNYDSEENIIPLGPERIGVKTYIRALLEIYTIRNGVGASRVTLFQGNQTWERDVNIQPESADDLSKMGFSKAANTVYYSVLGGGNGISSDDILKYNGMYLYAGTYQGNTGRSTPIYVGQDRKFCIWEYVAGLFWVTGFWAYDSNTNQPVGTQLFGWAELMTEGGALNLYADSNDVNTPFISVMRNNTVFWNRVLSAKGDTLRPVEDLTDVSEKIYPYYQEYTSSYDIRVSYETTHEATEWGLAENGEYFVRPNDLDASYLPIGQTQWTTASYWGKLGQKTTDILPDKEPALVDNAGNLKEWFISDCYNVGDVIKVLLAKFAPDITHEKTEEYSEFLYYDIGQSYKRFPIYPTQVPNFRLMICPASNLLSVNYDKPAQIAKTSLQSIFNMLRDVYQLYWFIDDDKRLRIEHLQWFLNGGSYTGTGSASVDLTKIFDPRIRKAWSFGTDNWSYDKGELVSRYEFEWSQEASKIFQGYPIEVKAPFVTDGKKEQVTVGSFMADIDTMLYNSGSVSSDGFVLLAANTRSFNATQVSGWIRNDGQIVEGGNTYSHRRYELDVLGFKAGDTLIINSNGSKLYPGCVFLNSNHSVIANYLNATDDMVRLIDKSVVIPANAKYVYLNQAKGEGLAQLSDIFRVPINPHYAVWSPALNQYVANIMGYEGRNAAVQNYWASFLYTVPKFFVYNLPGENCVINNGEDTFGTVEPGKPIKVMSVMRSRKHIVSVPYPASEKLNVYGLVNTHLGNGVIDKISFDLSSCFADVTLKYEPE